jgi:hypothetical protein
MDTKTAAYLEGFIKRCAALNLDPEPMLEKLGVDVQGIRKEAAGSALDLFDGVPSGSALDLFDGVPSGSALDLFDGVPSVTPAYRRPLVGAALGAGLGGLSGAVAPVDKEKGDTRLKAIIRRMLLGGAGGGALGYAGNVAMDPTMGVDVQGLRKEAGVAGLIGTGALAGAGVGAIRGSEKPVEEDRDARGRTPGQQIAGNMARGGLAGGLIGGGVTGVAALLPAILSALAFRARQRHKQADMRSTLGK